jgi:signal transduction histidine kinase
MKTKIPCPYCNLEVDANARNCQHCGIDLALAAVIAEYNLKTSIPNSAGLKVSPEILLPRLGDYLIEQGVLAPKDLQRALAFQKQKAEEGQPCLVGNALIQLGLIDRAALDQAVTEQIVHLQNALRRVNRQLEKRVQERTSELQQALNKLGELNEIKANFISSISHELRTPLTHIKGYLELLADGSLGPLSPQQVEALKILRQSEARLEKLIDGLIQFSMAARGELTISIEDFDLSTLVTQVISQFAAKANLHHVTLKSYLPDDLPNVRADQEKIAWVLRQLLDNAIKFTPHGGQIVVRVDRRDGIIVTSVQDTGIGIPEDRIKEIFEPFHQLDGSNTRRYPGTGLGLSMVGRILEAHGSSIKVHSVEGKGSIFGFSLPIINGDHDEQAA